MIYIYDTYIFTPHRLWSKPYFSPIVFIKIQEKIKYSEYKLG